jgi:hypothetical protein
VGGTAIRIATRYLIDMVTEFDLWINGIGEGMANIPTSIDQLDVLSN